MFKKPRKVARKVGLNNDAEEEETGASSAVVQRPSTKSTKPTLRTSFAADIAQDDEKSATRDVSRDDTQNILNTRRLISEKRAELNNRLAIRTGDLQDRPSYGADHLAELKNSNLLASRTITLNSPIESETPLGLDLDSKFGSGALASFEAGVSAIPTDAEIREKKERRRRLAKEHEFISLHDTGVDDAASDDENPRQRSLILPAEELKPKDKYGETRLIHEDEDIAEGFDEFTEDAGLVTLGKSAAREQSERRRKEMQEMIHHAEHGSSDSESADSDEQARNKAYETVQTRAGTFGTNRRREHSKPDSLMKRLEMAPKIIPLPELNQALEQAKKYQKSLEEAQEQRRRKLLELREQRQELVKEQQRLPILIKEAGERYEKWRTEAGFSDNGLQDGTSRPESRGLETFGTMAALPEA